MAVYTTNQYGRLVNVGSNEDNKVSASRNTTGSTPIGSSSNVGRFGDIETQVKNSPAYQSAFQILSHESDKSWLQRLEMIPYSVSDASSTIFDDIGASNNFNDKQDANYQYCMEQISALMAEYQSWKNSLPITQAQQFANAGVNSAITGQGLSSSQIPNVGVSSDPSGLASTNSAEVLGSLVGSAVQFILEPMQGFADLALKYKDLELRKAQFGFSEQSALMDFYKFATENGVEPVGDFFGNGWKGIFNGNTFFSNPKQQKVHANELLGKWLAHHKNSPLISGLAELYPELAMTWDNDGVLTTSTGVSSTPVGLTAVVKAQLEMYRNEEVYRLSKAKYESEISQYEVDTAEYNSRKAFYDEKTSEYLKRKHEITRNLIETLANSNHPDDLLLLSKTLLGYNYDDIDVLHSDAQFSEAEKSLGMFGTVVKMLTGSGHKK